jgi:NAD(P)-dependent dehydrogenase (short-subunit alcohol dehydrogenase family)
VFSLKGKNIVLTGAAGILGKEFSKILLNQGARLIGVDNKENPKASSDIEDKNFNYFCFDITQKEEWINLRDALNKENISVDVLINGAATKSENFFESFENFSLKEWTEVMEVNVTGTMLACQTFGPLMAERNSGSIINFLSIYGIVGPDQRIYDGSYYLGKKINTPAIYSTSKAAVFGLTKYLATYWGKHNVRINAITPGGIYSGQNEIFQEKYSYRVPLNRMGKAEDLFGALIFLASDASSYITGQNLIVDGGLTVW